MQKAKERTRVKASSRGASKKPTAKQAAGKRYGKAPGLLTRVIDDRRLTKKVPVRRAASADAAQVSWTPDFMGRDPRTGQLSSSGRWAAERFMDALQNGRNLSARELRTAGTLRA